MLNIWHAKMIHDYKHQTLSTGPKQKQNNMGNISTCYII